jgi:hypothetical protein
MAKGQRMLPPTGGAPIEVTPEFVQQEARKAVDEPPEVTPAALAQKLTRMPAQSTPGVPSVLLDTDLPAPDDPLPDIIAGCERIILAARIEFEEAERKAVAAWVGRVGPAVRLVHATKAYKEIPDGRGRPYKSFAKWASERCGISRPHAYRMVNEGPVAEALEPLYAGPLSTRQVDVLAPVLRQHNADSVRQLWATAEAAGDTGAVQLAATRDALRLAVQPEEFEPPKGEPGTPTPLDLVQRAALGVDRETLRRVALQDPDGARRAVSAARQFADDLQHVLTELEDGSPQE